MKWIRQVLLKIQNEHDYVHFLSENGHIFNKLSLKLVSDGPSDNELALVCVMAIEITSYYVT